MPHAPTPRPPRKRTQSQVTPVTRQRHSPATPQPATPQMPTPAIPPGPQTTAAPIVPNGATPPTHTRTLRSSKRPVEACQFTAPPTEEEQPQTPEPSTVNTPASLHETTASPPLKRSQSRAKPDTPQPTPATQKRPTPLGPPVPQAAAAHITAAEDMPAPPHPRILRPCKRPLEANQTFPPLMEPDQTQQSIVEQQRPRTTRLPIDNSGTTTARVPHHRALRSSMRPNAATQTQTPQQPTEKRQKRRRREGQCPEATPADARQERKREVQCPENTTQHIEPEAHHPEGVG